MFTEKLQIRAIFLQKGLPFSKWMCYNINAEENRNCSLLDAWGNQKKKRNGSFGRFLFAGMPFGACIFGFRKPVKLLVSFFFFIF